MPARFAGIVSSDCPDGYRRRIGRFRTLRQNGFSRKRIMNRIMTGSRRKGVRPMRIRFDGKSVAVSGAGHGFGRCISETFAQLGARVFGCDLSAAELAETAKAGVDTGAFGITVNSVAPGFVRSNAASEKQWAGYGQEGQRALVERIAMKRLGTAQDIANSVVFFASELAGFVNGQVLAIDGGK